MPKTPRLSREIVITEKIDGTNASVYIPPPEEAHLFARKVLAGSRTRWIEPGDDNFGFAAWVEANWEELLQLGPGQHFGEWWGRGIQRGYDLAERRFSLFNVGRWWGWRDAEGTFSVPPEGMERAPACCHVVPVLWRGPFSLDQVESALYRLIVQGSTAAPGFRDPEGVMVYHTAAGQLFKKTLLGDEEGKSAEAHPKKERAPKAPRDPNVGGRRKANVGAPDGVERRRA
jgi:hypothetical protein